MALLTRILTGIGRFILPADIKLRQRRLELTAWAFLLSLAYYPGYLGFLAWFSLVRPIYILTQLPDRQAFNAAYFFSFFFNLFSLYWVAMVTPPGTVAAVVIISFYCTIVLMMFHRLHARRPTLGFAVLPFLWVGVEYFRTLSEFAFPWSELGYTQAYYLYILQIVSIISVHGLSLIIVAVNVLLCQLLRKTVSPERKLTAVLLSLGTVALLTAYGWASIPAYPEEGEVDVALMQGSVPLEVKWARGNAEHSLRLYDSLTQAVTDTAVDLFVWPETSAPCYLTDNAHCFDRVADMVARSGAPHLVGALASGWVKGKRRYFNACYQFDSLGREEHRYDKVKLVPFSEHVPYQDHLSFMEKAFLRQYLTFIDRWGVQWWSDFYPGQSTELFPLGDHRYVTLICFECAFPEFVRESLQRGASFIVGITNDTWFGRSVGIHIHSRVFITRAVENRCWAARTANSGLTYIVDGYGRIRNQLDLYEVAVLRGRVGALDNFSIFTRIGDVAGKLSLLITVAVGGILLTSWVVRKIRLRFRV